MIANSLIFLSQFQRFRNFTPTYKIYLLSVTEINKFGSETHAEGAGGAVANLLDVSVSVDFAFVEAPGDGGVGDGLGDARNVDGVVVPAPGLLERRGGERRRELDADVAVLERLAALVGGDARVETVVGAQHVGDDQVALAAFLTARHQRLQALLLQNDAVVKILCAVGESVVRNEWKIGLNGCNF